MRGTHRLALVCAQLLWTFVALQAENPVTLERLRADAELTPKRFASYFSGFRYVFHPEIQPAETFLATRAGDCDDYAVLADQVLREKGYHTRLVAVRMPGLVTHVVCYVTEDRSYLDFNNRAYAFRLQRSGPELREIAAKVAKSFDANWTTASEFVFTNGVKHLVSTIAKTDTPGATPPPAKTNGPPAS